jgi:hypothetical protein
MMTANGKQFLTPADQFGQWDWIAEWEARANQALKWGDVKGYQGYQECLHILEYLAQGVDG